MRFLPRLRSTRVGGRAPDRPISNFRAWCLEILKTRSTAHPPKGDARDALMGRTKPRDDQNCIKLTPRACQLAKFCQNRANETPRNTREILLRGDWATMQIFWNKRNATVEWGGFGPRCRVLKYKIVQVGTTDALGGTAF
jgi:hypothetical protein